MLYIETWWPGGFCLVSSTSELSLIWVWLQCGDHITRVVPREYSAIFQLLWDD